MCTYKVFFNNGKSVNILAKNKEEIDNIITFALCDGSIKRVRDEIKSYQRVYKNGTLGKELAFTTSFQMKILCANW